MLALFSQTNNLETDSPWIPHIPFVELLGFELLLRWDNDRPRSLRRRTDHHNSFSVVHGGA